MTATALSTELPTTEPTAPTVLTTAPILTSALLQFVNKVDEDGACHGLWVTQKKSVKVRPGADILYLTPYTHGVKQGPEHIFDIETGRLVRTRNFDNNLRQGEQRTFDYQTGEIKYIHTFKDNVLHGLGKMFTPDGDTVFNYVDGKVNSTREIYVHGTDKLLHRGEVQDDIPHGLQEAFDPETGHLVARFYRDQGKLHGLSEQFNEATGVMTCIRYHTHGRLRWSEVHYYVTGSPENELHVVKCIPRGKNGGTVAVSLAKYKNDVLVGFERIDPETGNRLSRKQYKNNIIVSAEKLDPKTGNRLSRKEYDEKGNIKRTTEYDPETGKEIETKNYKNKKLHGWLHFFDGYKVHAIKYSHGKILVGSGVRKRTKPAEQKPKVA